MYTVNKVVPLTQWVPDSAVVTCTSCNKKFALSLRRHHCRVCGKIYCDLCSPEVGIFNGENIRMCDNCVEQRQVELRAQELRIKEKEERLLKLRTEASNQASADKEQKKITVSSPTQKDTQSMHKLKQQQVMLQITLQEEEEKERERKELASMPWKSTTWTSSSERIRIKDLGFELDNATPLPVDTIAKSKWMGDLETSRCLDCGFSFDKIVRRHHCRACGAIFCEPCSPEVGIASGTLVRICADCYHHAKNSKVSHELEENARRQVVQQALLQRKNEMQENQSPKSPNNTNNKQQAQGTTLTEDDLSVDSFD